MSVTLSRTTSRVTHAHVTGAEVEKRKKELRTNSLSLLFGSVDRFRAAP